MSGQPTGDTRGFVVTIVRYIAHAVDRDDALEAALHGAGETVDTDVEAVEMSGSTRGGQLLTAHDVPR